MRSPLPPSPDLLGIWRQRLLAALADAGLDATVGSKRPSSETNRNGLFVRIMCLGGTWRYRSLWYPRLAAESWAPSVTASHRLDAVVGLATRRMEGLRVPAAGDEPQVFISSCELDLAGSDQSVDGHPFTLTTTHPLCVQVTPIERTSNE